MTPSWHTSVPCPDWPQLLQPESQVVALGSCFAEHIGQKLLQHGLRGLVNPFGVIFNPTALADLVQRAAEEQFFTSSELVFHQDLYHHPLAHSRCSGPDAQQVTDALNQALRALRQAIQHSSHVFITLGTSWVYRDVQRQLYVANCHKRPAADFEKILLTPADIEAALQKLYPSIQRLQPKALVVWSISPVRHAKDGLVNNQRSKARLIGALHDFLERYPKQNQYFPAYELLLDELRDYRFYADDMLHPSAQAVDYIWARLQDCAASPEALKLFMAMAEVQRMEAHKPLHRNTDAYRTHQERLAQKKAALQAAFPHLLL